MNPKNASIQNQFTSGCPVFDNTLRKINNNIKYKFLFIKKKISNLDCFNFKIIH